MRSTVTKVFLILAVFASGCSQQISEAENDARSSSAPDCSFADNLTFAHNALEDSPDDFKSISWKTYNKIYSIPAMAITRISIRYLHMSLRSETTRCYEINLFQNKYTASDGTVIDKEVLQNFSDSFINLRLSSGYKFCANHTDDGSIFDVEIEYRNGQKAYLYTESNCASDHSPWNVVYGEKSYFQATGEIPDALYNLIESFDKTIQDWWNPQLEATMYFSSATSFSLVSNAHPVGTSWFSEKDVFQERLKASRTTSSYLKEFEIGELELECPMHSDCSTIDSQIELSTSENNATFTLDIRFSEEGVVVSNPIPVKYLLEIENKLLAHPYLKKTWGSGSDAELAVKCWMENGCREKDWCSAAYDVLGRAKNSEELVCSVRFGNGARNHLFSSPNDLYFFANEGLFWVKRLGINLGSVCKI